MKLKVGIEDVKDKINIYPKKSVQISELSSERVKELSERAKELAVDHSAPGCAVDTFYGISEALKIEGRKPVYMATKGLTGGCGETAWGTCGTLSGAACAISLSYGLDIEKSNELKENEENMVPFYSKSTPKVRQIMINKIDDVADKLIEKYGDITCAKIQFGLYGQALDLRDPRIHEKMHADIQNCSNVEGDVAQWATETLLKSTHWTERLFDWGFPRTVIARGNQFEREEEGFDLSSRFKS